MSKSPRYILLNPDDIHHDGDEGWNGSEWLPFPPDWIGQRIGESAPCRRVMRDAAARAEYNAALPGLLKAMKRHEAKRKK